MVKVYYVASTESPNDLNRLYPAPQISIRPEYYYANDTIIGYHYILSINGNATSIDYRNIDQNVLDTEDTIRSIQNIKNIFNNNGGTLYIQNDQDQDLFKAYGAIIRSINFENSDNRWYNYAPYSIELDANDIETFDCEGTSLYSPECNTIPSGIDAADSPLLLDMKKYRVKSFSDSWTMNLNEEIYNKYNNIENQHFEISYTINAEGMHCYQQDTGLLIPSWEQAKNFCQDRLKTQIDRLIEKSLDCVHTDDGCITIGTLSSIYGENNNGLLNTLSNANYKIYNELIQCEASEINGTFSITYNALVKKYSANGYHVLHTYTESKDISQSKDENKNTKITFEGQIRGLIEGGLIKKIGLLKFPNNGNILEYSDDKKNSKYKNALEQYENIEHTITFEDLGLEASLCTTNILPKSKNAIHNYIDGTINYTIVYDTESALQSNTSFTSVTITEEGRSPNIQEFTIPGRAEGPIIQQINSLKPRKLLVSIEGRVPVDSCCPGLGNTVWCDAQSVGEYIEPEIPGFIMVDHALTSSSDGSYTINRTYIEHN